MQQVSRNVEDNRHHQQLAPSDVTPQKGEVPACKPFRSAVVKVGVLARGGRGVVELVGGQERIERDVVETRQLKEEEEMFMAKAVEAMQVRRGGPWGAPRPWLPARSL